MRDPNHSARPWTGPRLRRTWKSVLVVVGTLVGATGACATQNLAPEGEPLRLRVEVLAWYPHDPSAFTQGLEMHGGRLYESTGRYGTSEIREVDPGTGEVLRSSGLPDDLFAEGLTRVDDQWIQLTWKAGIARVLDSESLELVDEHRYDGEGWGICHDGRRLVMSDGSDVLTYRDPVTFEALETIAVTLSGRPVPSLNELECAEGWIYANVWGTDTLVRIDPASGSVTAVIEAAGLLAPDDSGGVDVLNGIAYDAEREVFYLTGKWWPKLFEVRFVPG